MNGGAVPFLWLCGASGVGKSSVGWELSRQVTAAGVKTAYIDFDQVGFCLPSPAHDPDNHRVKAINLGAMWPNLRAAGARCLVASGVVDTAFAEGVTVELARPECAKETRELAARLRARSSLSGASTTSGPRRCPGCPP